MEQATLKIFGTGQITIPKKWRDFFSTNTLKAIFDKKTKSIQIKPVKILELENSTWQPLDEFKKDLEDSDFSKEFQKELFDGYKESNFYLSKK